MSPPTRRFSTARHSGGDVADPGGDLLASAARHQLHEAEAAGCPVVVLTVDQVGLGRNRDALYRYHRRDNPACQPCHASFSESVQRSLYALRIDPRDVIQDAMILASDTVDRIRDGTSMKLVIKGILTAEDAQLCVEHGVDGIVVSNHGGRAEDSGLAAFGQEGVEAVLAILRRELETIMTEMGTRNLASITPDHVRHAAASACSPAS